MARVRILTFAAAVVWAALASAEPARTTDISALPSLSHLGRDTPTTVRRPGLAFPIANYSEPSGEWGERRGIIAGKQIAPGTVLGLGIFQTAPKMRGYVGDVPQNMAPKRTKRAAIGLSVKF